MSKKRIAQLNWDIRARVTAEAERDAERAKVAALEAELAAARAPAAPPAAVTPPAPLSRLEQLRELKAQDPSGVSAALFTIDHHAEIAREAMKVQR